ncbi:MAG: sigma 54-interacting transcriptional regulator [Myxococcales bacterium]|nr:sigma 54-interacting transcriptional regulator [Myxococcales bacterium]
MLSRRGYGLAWAVGDARLEHEVLRVPMAGVRAAVITGPDQPSSPRSAATASMEHALLEELVRELLETAENVGEHAELPLPEPPRGSEPELPSAAAAVRTGEFHELIGRAPAMLELYRLIDRIASSDTTSVLIQGENGTGKELVARAIHLRSPRRHRGFVATNCSAFNDNLLDSELFGHKRGAFTGAGADKAGLFEVADQGTFFLDEIGDMSPSLQAKVLRLLQDGTYYRVGDTEPRRADVRIIAATHRDLATMVRSGEFREDLYYRINVINVVVPPLRDRRDDLPLLIERFLERLRPSGGASAGSPGVQRLSAACIRRMAEYGWPGNVRELENEIERLVVLAGNADTIDADLLTPRIRDAAPRTGPQNPESLPEAIEALEREMIATALQKHHGNKSRAAQSLQVSRRNLIRLVQKYGLDPTD